MKLKVCSVNPLTKDDVEKIKGIVKESGCTNESFKATFGTRFQKLSADEKVPYLDDPTSCGITTLVEV